MLFKGLTIFPNHYTGTKPSAQGLLGDTLKSYLNDTSHTYLTNSALSMYPVRFLNHSVILQHDQSQGVSIAVL